jgi:predicted PurR-regulated permease PerM
MLEPLREESPEDGRPRLRRQRLREALRGPFEVRALALAGLFVLAAFYTLYLARSFFLPIILALLLSLLLSPVVRGLRKLHVPEGLGAALVVGGLLGVLGLGVYELATPAYGWMQQAPQSLRKVERKLRQLQKPVQTMTTATEQVEKITKVGGGREPAKVTVSGETLAQKVFSGATDLVFSGAVMFILLYFLLASGDLFLRKLIKVLPSLADKKRAAGIARRIETEVSAYLATITLINLAVGVAVGTATWLIGLPNPLLWGALAAIANFIPYLGALTMFSVLAIVGFLTFDGLGYALLAPGAFLGLHLLESLLLTPLILGRRLTLNPVMIFLGLTFWGWLWGITGAVLAVPIMVVFKIVCDHSEPLAPIGELLGN